VISLLATRFWHFVFIHIREEFWKKEYTIEHESSNVWANVYHQYFAGFVLWYTHAYFDIFRVVGKIEMIILSSKDDVYVYLQLELLQIPILQSWNRHGEFISHHMFLHEWYVHAGSKSKSVFFSLDPFLKRVYQTVETLIKDKYITGEKKYLITNPVEMEQ